MTNNLHSAPPNGVSVVVVAGQGQLVALLVLVVLRISGTRSVFKQNLEERMICWIG